VFNLSASAISSHFYFCNYNDVFLLANIVHYTLLVLLIISELLHIDLIQLKILILQVLTKLNLFYILIQNLHS